jgi:hypothetical protein
MRNKLPRSISFIALLLFLQNSEGYGQVSITGPACVVPAIEYQYNISGNRTDTTNMQLCITGGSIAGIADSCYNGTFLPLVRVVWSDTISGSISIGSSAGSTTLNVNLTHALQGGKIDSLAAVQVIQPGGIPAAINCSVATGGTCISDYWYQWQQSADHVYWSDISGANETRLSFSTGLNSLIYFRRKVVVKGSGNEAYSDAATILITNATTGNQ